MTLLHVLGGPDVHHLSFRVVQCRPKLATARSRRKTPADLLLDAAEGEHGAARAAGPGAAGGAAGRRLLRAGPPQIRSKRRPILHQCKDSK